MRLFARTKNYAGFFVIGPKDIIENLNHPHYSSRFALVPREKTTVRRCVKRIHL